MKKKKRKQKLKPFDPEKNFELLHQWHARNRVNRSKQFHIINDKESENNK